MIDELNIIRERYEGCKKLTEEFWLNGDHEGNDNDLYQCGFVAGMNYKLYKDYTGENKEK